MIEGAHVPMPEGLAITYVTAPYRKGSGLINVIALSRSADGLLERYLWKQHYGDPGLLGAAAPKGTDTIVLATCLPADCATAGSDTPAETTFRVSRDGGHTFTESPPRPGRWVVIRDGAAVRVSELFAWMDEETQQLEDILGQAPPAAMSRQDLREFDGEAVTMKDGRLFARSGDLVFEPEMPAGSYPQSFERVGESVWGQYGSPLGTTLAEWTPDGKILRAYRLFDRQTGPQHREGVQIEVHGQLPDGRILLVATFRRVTSCNQAGVAEGMAPAAFDPETGQISFLKEFVEETAEHPCGRMAGLGMSLLRSTP
jgi:hypothetical protein